MYVPVAQSPELITRLVLDKIPLRWVLRGQGYWAHSWRLGRNIGPTRRIVTGMRHRVEELYETHGRTVSSSGHDLPALLVRSMYGLISSPR